MPPKSILFIGAFLSRKTGYRTPMEDLADRLQARGWNVWRTSEQQNALLRFADILAATLRFAQRSSVAHVDVFSGRAFLWAEAAAAILARRGVPIVATLHGGGLPAFAVNHGKRVRQLLAKARTVTAPSHYLLQSMTPYRAGIIYSPNPVDTSAFAPGPGPRAASSLIWVRSFHAVYNPQMAVAVCAELRARGLQTRLRMIGPDKGDGTLEKVRRDIREQGVEHAVEIVGSVPKTGIPAWLNQAGIFLNTTNTDNTPVSVLEALASGLCVVSTNVGGIPYLLEHRQDALLVPANDVSAMADAVRQLIEDPALAERLRRSGRLKVETFDWSVVLPAWERLLSETSAGASGA